MKLGKIVYLANVDPVPAFPIRTICTIVAVCCDMRAATFAYKERPVGPCLQAEGNQFQHLSATILPPHLPRYALAKFRFHL
jgi:hypothetical protein